MVNDTSKRYSDSGSYWLENGEGKFTLFVNSQPLAVADTGRHQGVILGGHATSPGRVFAPESMTIFDAIEKRLAISRVNEFRKSHQDRERSRIMVPWRKFAEERAAAARAKCPPEREVQQNVRQAIKTLNDGATTGGLSVNGSLARNNLCQAMTSLWKTGPVAGEPRQHIEAARELLVEVIDREPEAPFQDAARRLCEKALAAIEHYHAETPLQMQDNTMTRDGPDNSHTRSHRR